MKRILLVLFLFLYPEFLWAAVACNDGTCQSAVFKASGADTAGGMITTGGSDRLLMCNATFFNGSPSITDFTYNSVALDFKDWIIVGGDQTLAMYFQVAPTTGSNALSVTFDFSGTIALIGCYSFTGVDQVAPLGTAQTTETPGDGITITVPTDGLAVDGVAFNYPSTDCDTTTAGGSQTQLYNDCTNVSGNSTRGGGSIISATTTMTWSNVDGAYPAQIGVPINPVASAPPPPASTRHAPITQ